MYLKLAGTDGTSLPSKNVDHFITERMALILGMRSGPFGVFAYGCPVERCH